MRLEDEIVREWLVKAHHDLRSAERLLTGDEPIRDTGCFHCQQAAEKALKAFLAYHDIEFERSHSLVYLIDLCIRLDEAFKVLQRAAQNLTVYAVGIRYPGEFIEPDENEAQAALEMAHEVWDFVLKRLPAAVYLG